MKGLFVNHSSQSMPRSFLQKWLRIIERELPRARDRKAVKNQDIVIVFLDKSSARKLNFEHRGRDYATDVLSFEPLEAGILGELILCPQVIAEQAKAHEISFHFELGYLVLHGVLHLLGYEHEGQPKKAREMLSIQDDIFQFIDFVK